MYSVDFRTCHSRHNHSAGYYKRSADHIRNWWTDYTADPDKTVRRTADSGTAVRPDIAAVPGTADCRTGTAAVPDTAGHHTDTAGHHRTDSVDSSYCYYQFHFPFTSYLKHP